MELDEGKIRRMFREMDFHDAVRAIRDMGVGEGCPSYLDDNPSEAMFGKDILAEDEDRLRRLLKDLEEEGEQIHQRAEPPKAG